MRISGAHALQHVHEMQNLNGLAFDQDVTLSAPALAGDAQQQPFQPRACLDWLELLPKHLALIQRLLGSYWASTHKAHTSLSDCLAACMVCWPCRGGFLYSPSILIVVRQQQSVVLALTSCLFNISVLPLIFGRSLLPWHAPCFCVCSAALWSLWWFTSEHQCSLRGNPAPRSKLTGPIQRVKKASRRATVGRWDVARTHWAWWSELATLERLAIRCANCPHPWISGVCVVFCEEKSMSSPGLTTADSQRWYRREERIYIYIYIYIYIWGPIGGLVRAVGAGKKVHAG